MCGYRSKLDGCEQVMDPSTKLPRVDFNQFDEVEPVDAGYYQGLEMNAAVDPVEPPHPAEKLSLELTQDLPVDRYISSQDSLLALRNLFC